MSEIVNSFREEAAFSNFECSACVVKEHEYVANVYNMLLRGYLEYDDVVEVDE